MNFGLAVDGALVVLLATTLVFAFQLNRRLAAIRADQDEFGRLAANFAEAATRAEESVSRLKIAAGVSQEEIERADRLADDLRYLLERGTGLADRLESVVATARDAAPVLRRAVKPTPRPAAPAAAAGTAAGGLAAATRAAAEPAIAVPASRATTRAGDGDRQPRSRTERELLAALRTAGIAG
ncbi:MAG: DUF6468 domain-containing protein [Rhodospirillales bacterium]